MHNSSDPPVLTSMVRPPPAGSAGAAAWWGVFTSGVGREEWEQPFCLLTSDAHPFL